MTDAHAQATAPLQVQIEFERPWHFYVEGDVVAGHAVLMSRTDATLGSLQIHHLWRTTGGLAEPQEHIDATVAFDRRAKLQAGKRHRLAFEFLATRTPVTHHGDQLQLNWMVEAVASTVDGHEARGATAYIHIAGERKSHKKGKDLMRAPKDEYARDNRRFLKRCAVGGQLRPPRVWPGEATVCAVTLHPRESLDLRGLDVLLVRETTTITGKRKSPTVDQQREVVTRVPFAAACGPRASGDPLTLECVVQVPDSAAGSFSKPRERVQWAVELRAEADGSPVLRQHFPLVVLSTDE